MIKTQSQIDIDCTERIKSVLPTLHIDVEGTACKTIKDAFTYSLADVYSEIETVKSAITVDTATGSDLDSIGNSRNIFRSPGESDSVYRYRIINFFSDGTGKSTGAMISQIASLDGIAQVIMKPFAVGIGSLILYLVPSGPTIPASSVSRAQTILNSLSAVGIRGLIRSATIHSVQVHITLSFASGTQNTASLKSLCVSAINKYINSLQVGQPLIISQIINTCMNVGSGITDAQIQYLIINGRSALIRNFYPQEYAVIRPAANSAVTIS